MEMWKTLRVSHIPTPPTTTTDNCPTKRYTNIPLGTKDRSGHLPLPRTRRRFDQYDSYLKVWDLTEQGKTVPEIASLVFPDDLVWSAQQKVRDHLKVAKRLISGYSQEIR